MKQITFLIFLLLITLSSYAQDLRITEIMYNPDNADSRWEWVEVYNAGTELVDLTGYVIDDNAGAAYSEANISSGSILSGQSAILFNASSISEAEFLQVWGTVNLIPVTRWSSLNNGGDTIGIWTSFEAYSGDNSSQENVIEQVAYLADGEIWPEDDGFASIYLTDLNADSSLGTNWSLSTSGGVTPLFKGYTSKVFEANDGEDVGSPGLSGAADTEKPVILCPDDVNMISDVDNCGANFPLILPTATDNISTQLQFRGVRNDGFDLTYSFPIGETTVTWTAEDEAGNVSESCVQKIIITDEVKPLIDCPETIQGTSLDGNPIVIEVVSAIGSNVCEGEVTMLGLRSDEKELQEPFPVGTTEIVWKAIDASGNTAECTQMVTVDFDVSTANSIVSFSVPNQFGETILDNDTKTVLVKVPFGTAVGALVPTIEISEGAISNPASGVAQDFTNAVSYLVTAQDDSEQIWMVTVEIEEELVEEEEDDFSVLSFMLVNADTNEDLFLIEEGMIIDIKDLPTVHLDIRANTTADVESVRLSLDGTQSTSRTESLVPYALYQDLPIGDYKGNDFIAGSYMVSAVPYSENSLGGDAGDSLTLNFELINSSSQLSVTSFTLVNAETNTDLFELQEGMVIDINSLPTNHLDIRANTTDDVESVKLSLSGSQTSGRTESLVPYALFQDLPIGNYKGNNFSIGTYAVIGVPYSEDRARGSLGSSYRINFELVDSSLEVIDFMLVNADTDEDIFPLVAGMIIDINELPTLNLDIRANTTEDVESVRLSISGAISSSRTESLVPYALFQDLPIGDYKGNNFEVGAYTVSATPYSENSLKGQKGMVRNINFELVDSIVVVGAKQSNPLIISPNPAKTETKLSFENSVELKAIYIYDFNGRLLESYKADDIRQGSSFVLKVSGLPPANYIIRSQDILGNFHQEQLIISQE